MCAYIYIFFEIAGFKYGESERKPTVPRKDEKPVLGLKTNKNFITSNAVDVILQGKLRIKSSKYQQPLLLLFVFVR
jgi:hypothetical protein